MQPKNPFLAFPRDVCIDKDPLEQKQFIDLFFKDTDKFYRQYQKIMILLTQIMEELETKVKILTPHLDQIFQSQDASRFIDNSNIAFGFFYMFVYKDFAVREIVHKFIKNTSSTSQKPEDKMNQIFLKKILQHISYDEFVTSHFTQWMNLMLSLEVFQSYSSIVTPNEAKPKDKDGFMKTQVAESKNYQTFLKRYLKGFLKAQPHFQKSKRFAENVEKQNPFLQADKNGTRDPELHINEPTLE